jgi:hypothetical protein
LYENFIIDKFRKLASYFFFKKQNYISFTNFGKTDIRINREIRINYFEKNPVWSEKIKIWYNFIDKIDFRRTPNIIRRK